jgi:hypothetical protein
MTIGLPGAKNSNGDLEVVFLDLCCRALGARDPVLVIFDWNRSLMSKLLLAVDNKVS